MIQSALLSNIKSISQKNNISLVGYNLQDPIIHNQISEIPLIITLEGEPNKFIELLKALQKYPKLIDIKNLEIHPSENKYTLTITLTTYKIEKIK